MERLGKQIGRAPAEPAGPAAGARAVRGDRSSRRGRHQRIGIQCQQRRRPDQIGILSDCQGEFGACTRPISAEPRRTYRPRRSQGQGPRPTDGSRAGRWAAGRSRSLATAAPTTTPTEGALGSAAAGRAERRPTSLIGPLSGDEGIAIANYSKTQPGLTFLNGTSGAQDTTLKVRSPNFYRFNCDGAQWSAGVGDYAYRHLGWRHAVVVMPTTTRSAGRRRPASSPTSAPTAAR